MLPSIKNVSRFRFPVSGWVSVTWNGEPETGIYFSPLAPMSRRYCMPSKLILFTAS